jgi:hypothetical protein
MGKLFAFMVTGPRVQQRTASNDVAVCLELVEGEGARREKEGNGKSAPGVGGA